MANDRSDGKYYLSIGINIDFVTEYCKLDITDCK